MFFRRLVPLITLMLSMPTVGVAQQDRAVIMDPALTITQYARDVWTSEDGMPQASVSSIVQTTDGYLWLGTQEGLVRFDGREFDVFATFNKDPHKNTVSSLFRDSSGTLWVGTRGGGLSYYRDGQFKTVTRDDGLVDEVISTITSHPEGGVWVGTNLGVSLVRPDTVLSFTRADGLPGDNVSAMLTTADGRVWVGTSGGAAYYDGTGFSTDGLPDELDFDVTAMMQSGNGAIWFGSRGGDLVVLRGNSEPSTFRSSVLPGGTIRALLEDAAGSIWIGYDKSGIARIHKQRVEVLNSDNGLSDRNVRSIIEDREGSIWIGTDGGGLIRLRTGRFVTYTPTEGLPDDGIYGVYADRQNQVWAATEEGVARIARSGIRTYSTRNGLPSKNVISISGTKDGSIWLGTDAGLARFYEGTITVVDTVDGLSGAPIFGLYTDSRDRLWIAADAALLSYDGSTFTAYTAENGLSSTVATVVEEDALGDIWIGTYNAGVNRMRDGKVLATYDGTSGLLSTTITALHAGRSGAMWVGMRDGGLARIGVEGDVTAFTTQSGLFDNSVHHIEEDANGSLWMTSNRGVFSVEVRQLEEYAAGTRSSIVSHAFDRADGLISSEFNGGFQPAGTQTDDGRLWFPSTAGVVSVDPEDLRRNLVAPTVAIESVVIDGRGVADGAIVPPGKRRLDISFVGLSFIAPERTRYQYVLSGVDDGWRDVGNAQTASYTNLRPGRYTFRVRAANADGTWSREATVAFALRPYIYETPAFAMAVVAALVLIVTLLYRLRVNRLKQQHRELEKLVAQRTRDLQLEKDKTEEALRATEQARCDVERQKEIAEKAREVIEEQADRLREMDRIKSRFFGNISHEFRTPLTLTIGPLENAMTGVYGPVSPRLEKQLDLMLRNSRRLLRLINQLLDLSKLESGQFKLRPRRSNLSSLVEGVVLSFSAFAEMEQIDLRYEADAIPGRVYVDIDAVEKVFFNLLSNAVKFTPNGGTIRVSLSSETREIRGEDHDVAVVQVADTGAGIPASQLPHVFDRFHQVDGTVSRVQEGTGIGLALVKELVELHGGEINVESVVGKGTVFTVYLRTGRDHFQDVDDTPLTDESELTHGPMVEMAVFEDVEVGGDGAPARSESTPQDRATILVVDDSQDIRQYVVECLSDTYAVRTAVDGLEALESIRQELPDLVISDVMMPRMDGFALCRTIKGDAAYRHIPIVLLTSKASVEARIEGLEAGGDDYLAKPFNARELRTRIENLLSIRKQSAELHELNRALLAKNDALREASELKSQLLNIASHDMKNPLTAIREFARIVKDELGRDSHLQELLDLIYSSSNEMLHLVTQLLDSAALEGGHIQLDKRPVDLHQVAELIVHRNRATAASKGQTITYVAPDVGTSVVMADFTRIQEAMDNIVSNAIKYSPRDKSIQLRVEKVDDVVRFSVRDEGPGLTEEDHKMLFGKFQKLSAQPTGGESSTGLGLSIVKQIVELHEGEVIAESNEGGGATFAIELVALEDEHADHEASQLG